MRMKPCKNLKRSMLFIVGTVFVYALSSGCGFFCHNGKQALSGASDDTLDEARRILSDNNADAIIKQYLQADIRLQEQIRDVILNERASEYAWILPVILERGTASAIMPAIVRLHLAQTIDRGDTILLGVVLVDKRPHHRADALSYLGMIAPEKYTPLMMALAYSSQEETLVRQHAINGLGFSRSPEVHKYLIRLLAGSDIDGPIGAAILQALARSAYGYEIRGEATIKSIVDTRYSTGDSHAHLFALAAYIGFRSVIEGNNPDKSLVLGIEKIKKMATNPRTLNWVIRYALGMEDDLGPFPSDRIILAEYIGKVLSTALGRDFTIHHSDESGYKDWILRVKQLGKDVQEHDYVWHDESKVFLKKERDGPEGDKGKR